MKPVVVRYRIKGDDTEYEEGMSFDSLAASERDLRIGLAAKHLGGGRRASEVEILSISLHSDAATA